MPFFRQGGENRRNCLRRRCGRDCRNHGRWLSGRINDLSYRQYRNKWHGTSFLRFQRKGVAYTRSDRDVQPPKISEPIFLTT